MTLQPYEEHYFDLRVEHRDTPFPEEHYTLVAGPCSAVLNSVEKHCAQCNAICWIGPTHQPRVAAGGVRILCAGCGLRAAIEHRKAGDEIEFMVRAETLEEVARTLRDEGAK